MRLSAITLALGTLGWSGWASAQAAARADEPYAESEPAEAAPPEPIDVTVKGVLDAPVGSTGLTRAETRLLPGAFGDPFRAIEALPGVAPIASGVPYFYVRGAPPGDVGYFLDGVRVPLLFHLGLGPSVVHPGLTERVDLVPGGDPTIGRYAGGVVTADLSPPWSRPHADGNVRAVDAGAIVEVPWGEGSGAALAAGRYSYTALLFSLLNSSAVLDYWDYAGRVTQEVAPGHRLTVFGFGAHDSLGEKDEDSEGVHRLFDTTFHRLDLRYDHDVGAGVTARYDVILGWDATALDEGRSITDRMVNVRAAVHGEAGEHVALDLGVDLTADDYVSNIARADDDAFEQFFSSRTDVAVSTWAAARVELGRLELTPALRADAYVSGHDSAFGLDPSLGARVAVTEALELQARAALASQMPSFIVAGPGFRPGLDQGGLQRAFHTSLGGSLEVGEGWKVGATAYHVTFFDINDALGTNALSGEGFPEGFDAFADRFWGQSYGLELSVKRRLTKRLGAVVAMTVGRSERTRGDTGGFVSGFDRTFVGSAALTYDFGAGFRGGLKQLFYTGAPIIRLFEDKPLYAGRLPSFYRLDWRFEKRFSVGETGYVTLVAELLNSFFADEVIGEECRTAFTDGEPYYRCDPNVVGPVSIPSLGVEGGF